MKTFISKETYFVLNHLFIGSQWSFSVEFFRDEVIRSRRLAEGRTVRAIEFCTS